jgi:hypothetical protein
VSILQVLQIVVAVATILTGLVAFVRPRSIYNFIGLEAPGVRGISEIRAIFGGLLIGLGAAPLMLGAPEAYQMLGIGYLAIAVARLFSILYDRSFASSNLISLAVEVVFGAILML